MKMFYSRARMSTLCVKWYITNTKSAFSVREKKRKNNLLPDLAFSTCMRSTHNSTQYIQKEKVVKEEKKSKTAAARQQKT